MRGAAAAPPGESAPPKAKKPRQRQSRADSAAKWPTTRGSAELDKLAETPYKVAYGAQRQEKVNACWKEWCSVKDPEARGMEALRTLWNVPNKLLRRCIDANRAVRARICYAPATSQADKWRSIRAESTPRQPRSGGGQFSSQDSNSSRSSRDERLSPEGYEVSLLQRGERDFVSDFVSEGAGTLGNVFPAWLTHRPPREGLE